MKLSLLILTLFASSVFAADPTLMCIERGEGSDKVSVWGILNDGRAKEVTLKTASDVNKVTTFENTAMFGLNRTVKRIIIYFNGSDIRLVDFQLVEPFESKTFSGKVLDSEGVETSGLDGQALTNFSAMKTMILNKIQ